VESAYIKDVYLWQEHGYMYTQAKMMKHSRLCSRKCAWFTCNFSDML